MKKIKNSYQPFIIVFTSSLLFFYAFALISLFNVLQPHLVSSLNISSTTIGLISSASFYIEILLLFPAGPLLDSHSVKHVLLIALFISIWGVILTAFANGISALLLSRILMAVAGSFGFAGSVKLAVNWIPKEFLAQGIALVSSMGLLGGLVVQIPLSYSIAMIGWRHSLYGVGLIGITIFALIYFIVANHPKDTETLPIKINANKISFANKFKLAFINKQNLLCGIYSGLINLPILMLGAMWGVAYLMNVNHISELAASSACTMIFLGTLLGCPFVGFIADKFACRVRLMKIGALVALILILTMMLYPSQNLIVLIITYFALGLITSTQTLSYPTVIESNPKNISSSATSVISMMTMVGGAFSQPLFGFILHQSTQNSLIDITHAYQRAMAILPCAFLIAFIISLYIKDTHNKKTV